MINITLFSGSMDWCMW